MFNHIYHKYEDYYNNSKTKDIYLSVDRYKNWSVRKASFQGIAKKVFKGLKTNDNTFNLWNEGIYFEDYTLEGKAYKVAVYSVKEKTELSKDVRIKSFRELRYNKSIKAGYTKNYGLISFYDTEGKIHMVIQIIGDKPEKDVKQWLNYLGLILPSKQQEEEDKDILNKILEVILHDINKLNEIWGEKQEENDVHKEKIDKAIEEMKQYLGFPYEYGGGASRTSMDSKGVEEMDCSEFVSRFIQKACGLEKVPEYTTAYMSEKIEDKGDNNIEYIEGSEDKGFKDIKSGDIFLWRDEGGGHTGFVVSYDKTTDKVTVIEAIGESGSQEEVYSKNLEGYCKACIRISIYSRTGKSLAGHSGWKGYFRPKIN